MRSWTIHRQPVSRKPKTSDWMLTCCADGTGKTASRELVHLLIALRQQEIVGLCNGAVQGIKAGMEV